MPWYSFPEGFGWSLLCRQSSCGADTLRKICANISAIHSSCMRRNNSMPAFCSLGPGICVSASVQGGVSCYDSAIRTVMKYMRLSENTKPKVLRHLDHAEPGLIYLYPNTSGRIRLYTRKLCYLSNAQPFCVCRSSWTITKLKTSSSKTL